MIRDFQAFCCPECGASSLSVKPASPPHHEKLVCGECGHFLRWLPKPETVKKQAKLRATLEVLMSKPLVGWDRIFVRNLHKQARRRTVHLTQKQLEQLTRIVHVYLRRGKNNV